MGAFSDAKAAVDVQRIERGGTAKLSISQITCLIVNMPDAKRNLDKEQFENVYALYKKLRECKTKIQLDINGYYDMSSKIIILFNRIAPYEKFSGMNEIEAKFLLATIEQLYRDEEIDIDITPSEETKKGNKAVKVLTVLLLISLGLLAYTGVQLHGSISKEEYESNYAALKTEYENLSKKYETEIYLKNQFMNTAKELEKECSFWNSSAVIVTTSGEKYHTYGCAHIQNSNYYIYNVELAKVRGYEPCLDCDPPQ